MTTTTSRLVLPLALGLSLGLATGGFAQDAEAWQRLAEVRSGLAAASPLATDFVQRYTPAGFSVADEESGVLAMRLAAAGAEGSAECVRWDYAEPFPKGFLLCDRVAWTWNPGEESGRRHVVASSDTFGLDLLRLSVDQLRASYSATLVASGDDRARIELVPTGAAAAAAIRDATLEIDVDERRLLALSYHDVEGNLTRFELGDYRAVDQPAAVFTPPEGVVWLEN